MADDPILEQLGRVALFRDVIEAMGDPDRTALAAGAAWYGVPAGEAILRQGSTDTDMFLLTAGKLVVLVDLGAGPRPFGQIGPGELVGEMALIAREPRTATVVALRDSEVVRIPGALAERLLAGSAPFMAYLLRQLVERLRATTHRRAAPPPLESVAVLPLPYATIDDRTADLLRQAFAALRGGATVVDQRDGEALPADRAGLTVQLARDAASPFARRALRQADRVLLVGAAGTAPDPRITGDLAALARLHRPVDLMLVSPAGTPQPSGGAPWLDLLPPDSIFHVAADSLADAARVARLVGGQAVGVALAGGGARGFAHIGAIRALRDGGVPVDLLAGTSMGGLVGGCVAHADSMAEVLRRVRFAFVENKPIGDYTVPLVALVRGRRLNRVLRHIFGDARIEDLWRGFFCVSTNLTTGRAVVHRSGSLWRALRATSSLPGILPPVVEDGELLVDGALMNNFPTDLLAALGRGRVIGVDIAVDEDFRSLEADIEARSLLWLMGPGRGRVPNILKLLMRAGLIGGSQQAAVSRGAADLLIQPDLTGIDLLSFERYEAAIEAGYRAAAQALDRGDFPLP